MLGEALHYPPGGMLTGGTISAAGCCYHPAVTLQLTGALETSTVGRQPRTVRSTHGFI